MTTLYRPVLIETAEQAEALPEGTMAFKGDKTGRCMDRSENYPWVRGRFPTTDLGMIGWTALVPIEAKEETRQRDARPIRSLYDPRWKSPFDDHEGDQWVEESRLVTPWADK